MKEKFKTFIDEFIDDATFVVAIVGICLLAIITIPCMYCKDLAVKAWRKITFWKKDNS